MNIDNCGNCMFSECQSKAKASELGECRRDPPVVVGKSVIARWPVINLKTGHCWKYKSSDAV